MKRALLPLSATECRVPSEDVGGFPELGVPFLGVLIIRIMVFLGLYWGAPIYTDYHVYIDIHMLRI